MDAPLVKPPSDYEGDFFQGNASFLMLDDHQRLGTVFLTVEFYSRYQNSIGWRGTDLLQCRFKHFHAR